MKLNKQFFDKLEKQIEKDFGKCCWKHHNHKIKNYSPLCCVCQAWLAYQTLRDLYEIDYVVKKSIKLKKDKKYNQALKQAKKEAKKRIKKELKNYTNYENKKITKN